MTATALRQWHLTVHGVPRTKKNHGSVVWRMRNGKPFKYHVASAAWQQWVKNATFTVARDEWWPVPAADIAFNCRAHFYRDARRGDAVGFYQGLADLLEKRGIIANDSQLVSWDGSRLLVDKDNPRVEVTLEEIL